MTATIPILLVEDDESLRQALTTYLSEHGFSVRCAISLQEARAMVASEPQVIVLDWMLPDGEGIDLVREWRTSGLRTPVVFLTARADVADRVTGLELGANDYIVKPFEPRELVARLRVQVRTPAVPRPAAAGVVIDPDEVRAWFRGRELELTPKEFELLRFLVENAGKVFSRDEILDEVWGLDCYPTNRTVDTHVAQLRQKTAQELIETVRGYGYRLKKED